MDIDEFIRKHKDDVIEEQHKHVFWNDLTEALGSIYKLKTEYNKIDFFVPGLVLIEHKTRGKLDVKTKWKNAIEQAKNYYNYLLDDLKPKWIITCDFATFRIYDNTFSLVAEFKQENLADNLQYLNFFHDPDAQPPLAVNIDAADMMGKLHDILQKAGYVGHELEIYLTRLMFCLFAEDTGIFGHNQFTDYIKAPKDVSARLNSLFNVLNEPHKTATMSEELRNFPYINGDLFRENSRTLYITDDMRDMLLECASMDWSHVSPAIFGTMFQSAMDEINRRSLGAHYTSEENVLKLIKPLFLDALWEEFDSLKKDRAKLKTFHEKLRNLKFLDPACGCGNFLVIAYKELRKLEFEVIMSIGGQIRADSCKVNVDQFYGIEIDEWPAQIAKVSIWLMDHLMNRQFSNISGIFYNRIPLVTSPNIYNENALRMEWPEGMDYIMGNPPYVGARHKNKEQSDEMNILEMAGGCDLDYICAWISISARYMGKHNCAKTAFVTTNSICQGDQVVPLWRPLFESGIHINFSTPFFKWSNDSKNNAAVTVTIIGISRIETTPHINAYLREASDLWVKNRSKPICKVPPMRMGSALHDDNNYTFSQDEMQMFLQKEPKSKKYLREFISGKELIHSKKRYVLYLAQCSREDIISMPEVKERVDNVKAWRSKAKRVYTQKFAKTPHLYSEECIPDEPYLAFPYVSSERRRYIPIDFIDGGVVAGRGLQIIANASFFHFGILTSSMHMIWVKYICGRLKSDYRYSAGIVYNNFVWPVSGYEDDITEAAIRVLDTRKPYLENGKNLAWLYNPESMPDDLKTAHETLDAVVDAAYGLMNPTDDERFALLCKLYNEAIKQ